MVRMYTNGLGNLGSISGRVIPKTQKMVLDSFLLNTQHYKERIKGKVANPGKGFAPSPTAIEKGAFGSPSVANFTNITLIQERRHVVARFLLEECTKRIN